MNYIIENGPNSKPTPAELMGDMRPGKALSEANVQKYIDELDQALRMGAGGDTNVLRSMAPWLKAGVPATVAGSQYNALYGHAPPPDGPRNFLAEQRNALMDPPLSTHLRYDRRPGR